LVAEAVLDIFANLKPYIEEARKLPGVTDKMAAQMAIAQAKRDAKAADNAIREAKRASTAQIRIAEDTGKKTAEAASEAFEAAHKASEAAGGAFGQVTGPLTDVGDLLTKIGPVATAAIVGVAAFGAAVVALGANTVEVATHLDDYTQYLDNDTRAALTATAQATEGLHEVTTGLRVEYAGATANATTYLTNLMTGLAGSISDKALPAVEAITTAIGDWHKASLESGDGPLNALTRYVDGLNKAGEEATKWALLEAELAEDEKARADSRAKSAGDQLKVEAAAKEKAAADAKKRAQDAQREAERQAKESAAASAQLAGIEQAALVSQLDALDQLEAKRNADLAKIAELEAVSGDTAAAEAARWAVRFAFESDYADLRDELAQRGVEAQTKYRDEVAKTAAAEAKAAEAKAAADEQALVRDQQRAEAAQRFRDEAVRSEMSAASSLVSGISAATSAIMGMYDTTTAAGREAAEKAFRVSQAFALTDVAIKTAQAIMNAFTFPTPVGVALGVAAASLAGITQAAAISAQQPSFHAGLYGQGGLAADEIAATVRRGEVVVPAPTVMAAGGPEAVRDRVEGGGSGPTILYANMDGRRVMVPLTRAVGRRMEIGPRGHWAG
jgi:hypothetical protein